MSGFKNLSKSFSKKKKRRNWLFNLSNSQSSKISPQPESETTIIDKKATDQKVSAIVNKAKVDAQNLLLNAKSDAIEIKSRSEDRVRNWQDKLVRSQNDIEKTKSALAQNLARIQARRSYLSQQESDIEELSSKVTKAKENFMSKVYDLANTTEDEVKDELLSSLSRRLEKDRASIIQESEDKVNDTIQEFTQNLLLTVMPHGGIDYLNEYKSPLVKIRSKRLLDEIRGTKDCNKDFFEKLVKVELVFEEDGAIKINSQDSVNREMGRRVLEKLVKVGRVNPARIRRMYQNISRDMDAKMLKAGTQLCHQVGVYKLPKDIMYKLGRFKYRFSYGQNMIEHTLEETLIGIALAYEFGADSNIVRLGCLFHDIGKVINDDEGTHVETGVAYLKQMGIPQAVIDCVAQSHEDEPFSSIESIIVHISDGISGARPAARHHDHEFVNRVKYLEETPLEYNGVKEAYAIQAGREVRVVVDPNKVTDEEIKDLARDLRDRIKAELTYPGSVTVNVIREVSSTVNLTPESKVIAKS